MTTNNGSLVIKNKFNNNELFKDLIRRQRKTITADKKLQLNDLKRICKYINTSIFDKKKCCIWTGYITNMNNATKGTYINFYFKKKKVALHRLLYCNFVDDLSNDEYLKFNCENKGMCCNINHLKKFKYQKKDLMDEDEEEECEDVITENGTTIKATPKPKSNLTVVKSSTPEELEKKLFLVFE